MYPNDPSFRLEIPEAGIRPSAPFIFSTRVNIVQKTFTQSEITYTDDSTTNLNSFPNTLVDCTFKFRPNVDIPAGSVIQFTLPGFTAPGAVIQMSGVIVPLVGETDLSYWGVDMGWDQTNFKLTIPVPVGEKAERNDLSVFRVLSAKGGFRLPPTTLTVNDPSLTIEVIENQIIYPEPWKSSPRVVSRSFNQSEFRYLPPTKESIFLFIIKLQPTVNLTSSSPIQLTLPGFRNSLSKLNIHITGPSRGLIEDSMGQWNATTSQLTLNIPEGQNIPADTLVEIQIEESQGFILPDRLHENDETLRVAALNNIDPSEPVKISPKIGSGPTTSPPHMFCMMQHERGTKTIGPVCANAVDLDPPLEDPCDPYYWVTVGGCDPPALELQPISIYGFNLELDDQLTFLPEAQLCGSNSGSVLSSFSIPTNVTLAEDKSVLQFHGISSLDTGYFRICIMHQGYIFDVGKVVVRPACEKKNYVMVDGVCVQHCPKTKVPIAGACLRDPVAGEDWDSQALMLPVRMTDAPEAYADASSDDLERQYFVYRYRYELAKILNCDPNRIGIASLSNGSVIVNTVFKPVVTDGALVTTDERSPMGLISLLQALQRDTSSNLYMNTFFKCVNGNGWAGGSACIDSAYRPEPQFVRECPSDGVYRIFCPYDNAIMGQAAGYTFFVLAAILIPGLLAMFCFCAWQMDTDGGEAIDEDTMEKVRQNPKLVKPGLQVEYARSWLEGRFMGENWEKNRKMNLAITST
jgi:hypothetical protein